MHKNKRDALKIVGLAIGALIFGYCLLQVWFPIDKCPPIVGTMMNAVTCPP